MQEMTCQNCGAALEVENQFIRSVTCAFCGTSYVVSGGSQLDKQGQSVSLADYPSRLSVGARGTIKGREFVVLGRIRYRYEAGFWEEWQINWEDGSPPDWLEEDEGLWTLYTGGRIRAALPAYSEVSVGSSVSVNNRSIFVIEKRRGEVVGSEGQFAAVFPISGEFGYVTGTDGEQRVSVNYWKDEIELSLGEELTHNDIKIRDK